MNIRIRQETTKDHHDVEQLIEAAFKTMPYSQQTEHHLVRKLRKDDCFIPELSLVAESDGQIVGHILLTTIPILDRGTQYEILNLAPVSVAPKFQKQGIGSQLIHEAHAIGSEMGYAAVMLIGHADYYPRFGYETCAAHGITVPFDSAEENCMVKELNEGELKDIKGKAIYPPAFFE